MKTAAIREGVCFWRPPPPWVNLVYLIGFDTKPLTRLYHNECLMSMFFIFWQMLAQIPTFNYTIILYLNFFIALNSK